jgi:hypothetical protein
VLAAFEQAGRELGIIKNDQERLTKPSGQGMRPPDASAKTVR